MAFTNFTSLGVGPGTTPELDANFSTLSQLANIPVTVSGTNTLTLTQSTPTAALTLQNYLVLEAIASATCTGAVTANFNSSGALNVYKDTSAGPILLVGGEIVLNCRFSLIYDSTLNSNAGGYHLSGGGNSSAGATITAQSINSTLGSIANLTVSSFFGTSVSAVSFVGTSATIANLQIGNLVNPLVRMQSSVVNFSVTAGNVITTGGEAQATVSFVGATVGDAIVLGFPATTSISAGLIFQAFVAASNSIIFRIHNSGPSTMTVSLFTIRFVDIGFAT